MHILMVTPALPDGGGSRTLAPLVRQIQSLRDLGLKVDVLQVRGVRGLKYLQTLPRAWAAARPVDLIHAHYGFCGWLARTQLETPVVVSFMGTDLLGKPGPHGRLQPASQVVVSINRKLARVVDRVIVKSSEMARVVRPVDAHVVPNGVDVRAFRPRGKSASRELLGWPAGRRYVLFPGDPKTPRKGFALARTVFERAKTELDEPLELVTLTGVPPEQAPLYMSACDAMLLTSLLEGSPNVVKEAMACELPVVAVPVGDVSELLGGVAGYAVRPRDPEALARTLVETLRLAPRTEGRARLTQCRLDLESVARRIKSLYQDVLTDRPAGTPAKAPGPEYRDA